MCMTEMPKFKKDEKELANHLEKWLYFLNNVEDLSQIPKIFKDDKVLENAFDIAEYLALDKDKKFAYQQDLNPNYAIEISKDCLCLCLRGV